MRIGLPVKVRCFPLPIYAFVFYLGLVVILHTLRYTNTETMNKKKLESMLAKVTAWQEQVNDFCDGRDDTASERSDAWQESEKSDEFEEKTDLFREIANTLEACSEALEEAMNA